MPEDTVCGISVVRAKGNSLGITITDACRELGLDVGDMVAFTVRRIPPGGMEGIPPGGMEGIPPGGISGDVGQEGGGHR